METLLCEVVGCAGSAVYVRVARADDLQEEDLCPRCWQKLHALRPKQAGLYQPLGSTPQVETQPVDSDESVGTASSGIVGSIPFYRRSECSSVRN